MCQLFDRIVYGIPIPALSFLMAVKVLNEQKHTREALRKIRGSRLPNEIIDIIDIALVEGKASKLRQEWWISLKQSVPPSFDVLMGTEQFKASGEKGWIEMLHSDLLWEIADSSKCCLSPRPASTGEEHELVRHVREYFRDLPSQFKIVNRAPLAINSFLIDEKLEKNNYPDGENDNLFFVICMPESTLQKNIGGCLSDQRVVNQLDLDNCGVDELETTWGWVERVNAEIEWKQDQIPSMRREFEFLLRECDLALGNEDEAGLLSTITNQLGWWNVSEVVCDCCDDS